MPPSALVPHLRAAHVGKVFGSQVAVKDLSLEIFPGECFGLLGPNGAGKSTMIKIIYGVVARSSGQLEVLGMDPQKDSQSLRRHLGVVMQEDSLDEAMTVRENMIMFCNFHGIRRKQAGIQVDQLLEEMSLHNKSQAPIFALSGGMKRRLAFVRALLCQPKILILDEPTTGLDPAVRHVLWEKIRKLKSQGTTIILTTHYMDEAEILCDRLVIMDQGSLKGEGSPRQLIDHHCPGYVVIYQEGFEGKRQQFASLKALTEYLDAVQKIQQEGGVHAAGFPVAAPTMMRPSNLEDVFLKLTGRELDEHA